MPKDRKRETNIGTIALVIASIGFLIFTGAYAWKVSSGTSNVQIGVNGWIALGLGVAGMLVVGVGLMFLIFYSSRRGYDELDRK